MQRYEYKVIPAPAKAQKARGVKTPEGKFARTVEDVLNEMGAEGWEFQRAETLPAEERSGLTGSTRSWRTMLVFRRVTGAAAVQTAAEVPVETQTDAPALPPEPALSAVRDEDVEDIRPLAPATWPDGTPMTASKDLHDDDERMAPADEDRRS